MFKTWDLVLKDNSMAIRWTMQPLKMVVFFSWFTAFGMQNGTAILEDSLAIS